MATPLSYMQRMQLAQKTRERFLADAQKILVSSAAWCRIA